MNIGRLINPDQQLRYVLDIQLAIVDIIYKVFNEDLSMQNEVFDEETYENQKDDLANEGLINDKDGSFHFSFPIS